MRIDRPQRLGERSVSVMNADWHRSHVLASNAPMDARIEWHLEHARECACRPIPPSVLAEIEARTAGGT
jgi:hypothetical protein